MIKPGAAELDHIGGGMGVARPNWLAGREICAGCEIGIVRMLSALGCSGGGGAVRFCLSWSIERSSLPRMFLT